MSQITIRLLLAITLSALILLVLTNEAQRIVGFFAIGWLLGDMILPRK